MSITRWDGKRGTQCAMRLGIHYKITVQFGKDLTTRISFGSGKIFIFCDVQGWSNFLSVGNCTFFFCLFFVEVHLPISWFCIRMLCNDQSSVVSCNNLRRQMNKIHCWWDHHICHLGSVMVLDNLKKQCKMGKYAK